MSCASERFVVLFSKSPNSYVSSPGPHLDMPVFIFTFLDISSILKIRNGRSKYVYMYILDFFLWSLSEKLKTLHITADFAWGREDSLETRDID